MNKFAQLKKACIFVPTITLKTNTMKNNGAYINEYGAKTSAKLEKIKITAWEWANDGGNWARKRDSIKMIKLRVRFEKEAEKIGGVNYTFGDCLA